MPMPTLLEPEELEHMPEADYYELVDGRPVEKYTGAKSDAVALSVGVMLFQFVRPHRLGHVYGSQTGYRCFPHRLNLVRIPDASFVAKGRLPDDTSPDGYILIAPDLAVEVISPNDTYEEIEEKVADYRKAGVKLVWIVSPKSQTVLIRRLDGSAAEVGPSGELSGESVIPGFSVPVTELFV
jgi:Uma2 family endonuclease